MRLHHEPLEFLGDSVLGLVISDVLSEKFPAADEGKLSKMRSALVKEETLAKIARSMRLGEHLRLGKGEESTQGRDKGSILASTYEAVLGAIYLDGGLPAVFAAARTHFQSYLEDESLVSLQQDTKTLLQELCQARFRKSPLYRVVSEEGPDHEKMFEVMVSIEDLKRFGRGRNKKEAEQAAARRGGRRHGTALHRVCCRGSSAEGRGGRRTGAGARGQGRAVRRGSCHATRPSCARPASVTT